MNANPTNFIRGKFPLPLVVCLAMVVASLGGCRNIVPRGQSPDSTAMKFSGSLNETTYVGNLAAPWGLNSLQVEGIALVNRLKGTGSNPRATDSREHLVAEMHSHGVGDVDEYLASNNNSLVLAKGFLPPAAQKGDRFDLFLVIQPNSDSSSLENGYMMTARMRYMAALGGGLREGGIAALGSGALVTNNVFDPTTGDAGKVQGIIPGGGIVGENRPVGLAIQRSSHSVKNSTSIATAINGRFTTLDVNARIGVANPKSDKLIEVLVPGEYKLNVTRFFRVLLSIAINEPAADRLDRLQRCEREIHEPGMAKISALRLEGIGKDAIPSLKRAMRSDDPEIRFQAAQAITYMGESDGVEELESAAQHEPAFRWHALTALASCEKKAAEDALRRLLDVASAETRYGAFRALHQREPGDPIYNGELISKSFNFVVLPTQGEPMVHVSKKHRSEIVLFGVGQSVGQNFLYVENGLTVKAKDSETIEVTRFLPGRPQVTFGCSTDLEDLLPKLVRSGCGFATIIKVLKEAKTSSSLSGKLVINALPDKDRKYDRSTAGAAYKSERSKKFASDPPTDLFDSGSDPSSSDIRTAEREFVYGKNKSSSGSEKALQGRRKPWSIIPNIFR